MSAEPISRNPDLQRLQDEGYSVEIRDGYVILRDIPYVNSRREIQYGVLISDLSAVSGDTTVPPVQEHAIFFAGDPPCDKNGARLSIYHSSPNQQIAGLTANHKFSVKPPGGYQGYFEKMAMYASIIAHEARAIDGSITEKPHRTIEAPSSELVHNYPDTNSSRAGIDTISNKLSGSKIAIIGLGGTGSYVLDFVAKTHVSEIHLFDGDNFLDHNAFRAPGAASRDELSRVQKKVHYFSGVYSRMHANIVPHAYHISDANLGDLSNFDFAFIAIDNDHSLAKRQIVDYLIAKRIAFVDVGICLLAVDDRIAGQVRVTACTPDKSDHIPRRICFGSPKEPDPYDSNIQIAELNALTAVLAVIKWKKLCGFYQDLSQEFNATYSLNDGILVNDDHKA